MEMHITFHESPLLLDNELYVSQNTALERGMLSWVYIYSREHVCRITCLDPPWVYTDLNLCFGEMFILVSVVFVLT